MFRLVKEDGEAIKAEHVETGRVFAKMADIWQLAPGTLEQHLRFHPYAEVHETAIVPGLEVDKP